MRITSNEADNELGLLDSKTNSTAEVALVEHRDGDYPRRTPDGDTESCKEPRAPALRLRQMLAA